MAETRAPGLALVAHLALPWTMGRARGEDDNRKYTVRAGVDTNVVNLGAYASMEVERAWRTF